MKQWIKIILFIILTLAVMGCYTQRPVHTVRVVYSYDDLYYTPNSYTDYYYNYYNRRYVPRTYVPKVRPRVYQSRATPTPKPRVTPRKPAPKPKVSPRTKPKTNIKTLKAPKREIKKKNG